MDQDRVDLVALEEVLDPGLVGHRAAAGGQVLVALEVVSEVVEVSLAEEEQEGAGRCRSLLNCRAISLVLLLY